MKRLRCAVTPFALLLLPAVNAQTPLQVKTMPKMAQIDPRFVSYNIEAIELTGGRFWKPFPKETPAANSTQGTVYGGAAASPSSDPYEYRPPIDLSNPKLRKLAAALGPAYVRVSGTWRNSTFFQDDDLSAEAKPPEGFKGVMTRAQWKGMVDFAKAVDAELVTSVAMSAGTRDAAGHWNADQARSFFEYTSASGARIAAAEFMNEPTFASQGAAPKGYGPAAYAEDIKNFESFLRKESPKTVFLGPGSIGEGIPMVEGMKIAPGLKSEDLLKATGPVYDAFSYHFYTTLSQRCVGKAGLSWETVLTPAYLDRNPQAEAFYAKLRDTYLPGKPIWNTETGEAGCGGDRWASSFVDSFRFVDQLGALAQRNVQTVIVNTLASSDYGLLDENTYTPRPNYWAALLWKQVMGTRVLNPGTSSDPDIRLYAQCARTGKGAVALAVLNLNDSKEKTLTSPVAGLRYSLSASDLLSKSVALNGAELNASLAGDVPALTGVTFKAGSVTLAPKTITYLVLPSSGNAACK